MNSDDKILKILESIDKRLDTQGKDIADVKHVLAHTHKAVKALATTQDVETVVESAKTELKVEIINLAAKVIKKLQSHERRVTHLEEETGTQNSVFSEFLIL